MNQQKEKRALGKRVHWILAAWIGITGFIALNRGIDLLWGVAILLIFAAVAAAVLPYLQLLGIRARRLHFPPTAVVGEPQRIGYEVDASSRLPRYGLEIHEQLDGNELSLAAFVPTIRGRTQLFFRWTPRMRGCWRLRDIHLESRYPLGLTRSRRELAADEHEIVVYPDFVHLPWLPVHDDAHGIAERTQAPQRGGTGEFFALKPYRHGDDARSVHWRASARLNEVVTRENERQAGRQLWIVLELAGSLHVGVGPDNTCEQMIRIAHSVIVKAQAEGVPVGLIFRVADTVQRIPPSADRSTYERLRDTLARVQTHAQVPARVWLQQFQDQLPVGGTWLLFNLSGKEHRAELQIAARRQSATPVLVELDTESVAESAVAQIATLRSPDGLVCIVPYGADLTGLFRP